jgi:hypothetical protein
VRAQTIPHADCFCTMAIILRTLPLFTFARELLVEKENSQPQCQCGTNPCCGWFFCQGHNSRDTIFKMCSEGLWWRRHDYIVHLMRVCCTHTSFMTVYPDVVKIHNGRPLHVDAKEHRAKCEAFISDVPVVHLRKPDGRNAASVLFCERAVVRTTAPSESKSTA